MSNNTSNASIIQQVGEDLFVTYYPFTLVIVGTLLNFSTLVILCRPSFQDTNKRPTIHYMRAIAIFDIFMLYGWNLDHYLSGAHGFTLLTYSIISCKIFSFLNYFSAQSSAWLRVFICLDRYLSISRPNRTSFCRSKSVLMIIGGIVAVFTLLNSPLLIVACYYQPNGVINPDSQLFRVYPLWDHINLGVYNCTPFLLMVIFNSGVIYHLIRHNRTTTVLNSRIQHRSISITLVITTFLFSLMTIPATVAYGFFSNVATVSVLHALDSILYTYHITSFPLYLITFGDFRREFIALVTCLKNNPRVAPTPAVIPKQIPAVKTPTVQYTPQIPNPINPNQTG
jgi:hypothetical protein